MVFKSHLFLRQSFSSTCCLLLSFSFFRFVFLFFIFLSTSVDSPFDPTPDSGVMCHDRGIFNIGLFFNMISSILGIARHILGRSWCKTVLTCCVFYIGRKFSGKSLWGKSPRKSPKEKFEEKSPLANCSGKFHRKNSRKNVWGKHLREIPQEKS